jgi:general secretion pathway protein M
LKLFSTPLISRLAALLLLLTVLLGVYTLLVEPIIVGYDATSQDIEEARDQLARFERAAAMRPALLKQIKEFEAQQDSLGYFLRGGTDALAAADLQDRVNDLIAGKGGTLQSIQPMPGVEEEGLMRITLRVQMTGTTATLFDVLYALESGSPVLFIDELDIRNRSSVQASADAGGDAGTLTVAFDLSGYLPKEPQ